MNKTSIIVLTFFTILVLLSCNADYSKHQAFEQVKVCLDFQMKTTQAFKKRNPYLKELTKDALDDKYTIDKSNFKLINQMSSDIDRVLNVNLSSIDSIQQQHSKNDLFMATAEYLVFMKKFNTELTLFLTLIEDTIKHNEEDMSIEIGKIAKQSKIESNKWKESESEFYDKHNISQKEVDSIVNLIKVNNNKFTD